MAWGLTPAGLARFGLADGHAAPPLFCDRDVTLMIAPDAADRKSPGTAAQGCGILAGWLTRSLTES